MATFMPQNSTIVCSSSEKEEVVDLIINYLQESINQVVEIGNVSVIGLNIHRERSRCYLTGLYGNKVDVSIHPENIFKGKAN